MSFGRPPSINVGFKVSAPDRGSFPLDHYGWWRRYFVEPELKVESKANARKR